MSSSPLAAASLASSSFARRTSFAFARFVAPLGALSFSGSAPASASDVELAHKDQAVLHGHQASADEQWGTVALLAYTDDRAWGCSGTLIAPRVIVTAAHCVRDRDTNEVLSPESFEVIAGALDMRDYDDDESYRVTHVAAHEHAFEAAPSKDPTGLGLRNDIAVLETDRPVTQLDAVPIFPMHRVDEVLRPGAPLVIAGYGMRMVNADGESEGDGLNYVGEVSWQRRSAGEFLAGDDSESDTCPGDSGGPVYFLEGEQAYLVGATARGRDDFADVDCGQGGIYTLVPAYAAWLIEHVRVPMDVPHAPEDLEAGVSEQGRSSGAASGADDGRAVPLHRALAPNLSCSALPHGSRAGSSALVAAFACGLFTARRRARARARRELSLRTHQSSANVQ